MVNDMYRCYKAMVSGTPLITFFGLTSDTPVFMWSLASLPMSSLASCRPRGSKREHVETYADAYILRSYVGTLDCSMESYVHPEKGLVSKALFSISACLLRRKCVRAPQQPYIRIEIVPLYLRTI